MEDLPRLIGEWLLVGLFSSVLAVLIFAFVANALLTVCAIIDAVADELRR